jgi:hypothetical protein
MPTWRLGKLPVVFGLMVISNEPVQLEKRDFVRRATTNSFQAGSEEPVSLHLRSCVCWKVQRWEWLYVYCHDIFTVCNENICYNN